MRKAALRPYVSAVLKACVLQVAPPGVKHVESSLFSAAEIIGLNAPGAAQARVDEGLPLLTTGLDWIGKARMDDEGLRAKLMDEFEERMAHYFHNKKIKGRMLFKSMGELLADLVQRVANATGTPLEKVKHPFGDKIQEPTSSAKAVPALGGEEAIKSLAMAQSASRASSTKRAKSPWIR